MRFLRRPDHRSRCIAVFCGAFHPPTVAHIALAERAKKHVDQVLWVLPEQFPHKHYETVSLAGRVRMILEATHDPIAIAQESLFFSIAEEAQQSIGTEIRLLIGEDGVRRVVEWDYGFDPETWTKYLIDNLARFPVLSVRRSEEWDLPAEFSPYVEWIDIEHRVNRISSTLVRECITLGRSWKHLVPKEIHARLEEFYGSAGTPIGQ